MLPPLHIFAPDPNAIQAGAVWNLSGLARSWMTTNSSPWSPIRSPAVGASRFIGYSPTAGRVLTVIAFRDDDGDLHGINAWPATGADLKLYREGD